MSGQLVTSSDKKKKCLIACVPFAELSNYLFVERIYSGLEVVYDAAKNKTNLKKVIEIQSDLKEELLSGELGVPLALTVVLEGKSKLTTKKGISSIEYERNSSFVIGNILMLIATLKILGIKAPIFSSRLGTSDIKKNSIFRQVLAKENVVLTFIFNDESEITTDEVRELFFKYNRQNSGIHFSQFSPSNKDFPLRPFVAKLTQELDLERYGGVSSQSKHIKVSDNQLTTEYILFKFLVGSVAGAHIQELCKMSDDVKLSTGQKVSEILSGGHLENIKAFLTAWLEPLESNAKEIRLGFRLSAQIWQALGLVVYKLIDNDASIEDLSQAGSVLGKIDYGKKASHWHDCDVMGLDSNGRLYKNAANSTREFRIGLAEYFIRLLDLD